MKSTCIRLGVLGAGEYFSLAHLPQLQKPDVPVEVVALCRRSALGLQNMGAEFPDARLYAREDGFFAHLPLDAVLISTPHHLHYRQVKEALGRNLHVLVDKPLCLCAIQAEELVHMARERRRVLSVAYSYHYWPHVQQARRLVAQGALGKITSVACLGAAHAETSPILDPNSWYQDVEQSGGGSMASGGTHRLEAILWLTGLRPERLYAFMQGPAPDLDYQASLTMQLEGGVPASLLNEAQGPFWQLELSIYGEKGALFIRNRSLELFDKTGRLQKLSHWPPEISAVEDFARAILEGSPLLTDAEGGYWAVAAIEAAYRSAACGRAETVRPFSQQRERDGEKTCGLKDR